MSKSYTRGSYKKSSKKAKAQLDKVEPFRQIFTQMVTDARAHYNILDVEAAALAIPDCFQLNRKVGQVERVGDYDLLKKIKLNYGALGALQFKAYFNCKKKFDKKRLAELTRALKLGIIEKKQYDSKIIHCYCYVWTLREEHWSKL